MCRTTIVSLALAMLPGVVAQAAPPDTQPANNVVLVLPIAPPSSDPSLAWVGKGIQQDLVADLGQLTPARVIAPASAPPVFDEQAALDQGRQYNAGFVLYGQSQASNGQLRVTGQLMDTATARPLAAVKATAPTDNLFPLEDSLAAQAAQALPPPLGMARITPTTQPAQYASAEPPASPYTSEPLPTTADQQQQQQEPPPVAPQQTYVPAAGSNPYYSYTEAAPPVYYQYNSYYVPYYWGNPYYGYGYPYYYPYVGVGLGFGYYGWYHPWYHYPYYGYRGYYRGGARGPYYPVHPGRGYIGHSGGFGGGFHGGSMHGGGGAGRR